MRLIYAFLICLLLPFTAHAANGVVKDLRLFQVGNETRIILDISAEVPYRAFVLNNPMRLVVDLPLLEWQAPMNKGDRKRRIKSYRHSVFQQDTRRVVFDLNTPVVISKSSRLPPDAGRPWQYIFDLKQVNAVQFQSAISRVVTGGGASADATQGTRDEANKKTLQKPTETLEKKTPLNEAMPAMETAPVLTADKPKKKPLIVIDAGHGGVDPGALAANGVYEKNITLNTAKKLRDALLATGRYRVYMTRDRDIYIKLPQRVAIARKQGADMFISLHADTIMRPGVQGSSVYTLSDTASDAETAKLAERENAVDSLVNVDVGDVDQDVADILIDLVTRDTMNQSKVLAQTVVSTFHKHGVRTLPERPHRSAGFAVLKAPDVPSVLIEMGYLSNRSEANLLITAAHQQKIAQAIVAVVDRFFTWNE